MSEGKKRLSCIAQEILDIQPIKMPVLDPENPEQYRKDCIKYFESVLVIPTDPRITIDRSMDNYALAVEDPKEKGIGIAEMVRREAEQTPYQYNNKISREDFEKWTKEIFKPRKPIKPYKITQEDIDLIKSMDDDAYYRIYTDTGALLFGMLGASGKVWKEFLQLRKEKL